MRWLERVFRLGRETAALGLGVYAANGAYFLVLSVFPGLELAALLVDTLPGMAGLALGQLLESYFPRGLEGLLGGSFPGRTPVLGIVAVWSASRGMYGLILGLMAVYGKEEVGSWLGRRLLCLGLALTFLAALLLVIPLAAAVLPGGFVAALAVQTPVFAGLYLTVSGRKKGLLPALAGAGVAAAACTGLLQLFPHRALTGVAGALVLVYLWAWIVLLGAVFHAKLLRN